MKKFLIATDLSPRSDRALNRALALTDEFGAKLTVLHVVDEDLPASVADQLMEEAKSAIDDHLDTYPTLKRNDILRKVVFGIGFKDILEEANKVEADLIIMGTHREGSLSDLFLGTTVERVIRRGNDPVLVVKDRVKGPYRRVLVGVDFSVYSRRAVEFAIQFVPKGEIHVVHAFDVPFKRFLSARSAPNEVSKKHRQQMDAMLEGEIQAFLASLPSLPKSLNRILQEGSVREVMADQVRQLRPDLLVVGTHGRTGMAHAFLGSTALDLLSDPPCDVLAVKAW